MLIYNIFEARTFLLHPFTRTHQSTSSYLLPTQRAKFAFILCFFDWYQPPCIWYYTILLTQQRKENYIWEYYMKILFYCIHAGVHNKGGYMYLLSYFFSFFFFWKTPYPQIFCRYTSYFVFLFCNYLPYR